MVGGLPSSAPANFPLAPSLNLVASIYWHKATQQNKTKLVLKAWLWMGSASLLSMSKRSLAALQDVIRSLSGGGDANSS